MEVGKIPVSFDDDHILWMKQIEPIFGKTHNPKNIASIINLSEEEIDSNYPIQDISTGIEFMLIPVKTIESIKSASMRSARVATFRCRPPDWNRQVAADAPGLLTAPPPADLVQTFWGRRGNS